MPATCSSRRPAWAASCSSGSSIFRSPAGTPGSTPTTARSSVRRLSAGRLQLLALLQQGHGSRARRGALTHYDRADAAARPTIRIQELLARDNPFIFTWWIRQLEPISVDFKGFDPNPVVEDWNAWQWSI